MAFELDTVTGDITCRQGDSGSLSLSGIPSDKEYVLYWACRDSKNNIITELSAVPVEGAVTFKFTPAITGTWTVPSGMRNKTYYWAVKLCYADEDYEDTLIVGKNKTIASVNKLIVYPKVVEGTE